MADIPLPSHRYIPGRTDRHADDAFDAFHNSVHPDMDVDALQSTVAWRAGLMFLDHGYFWEAHEVLEPVWMATARDSAEHQLVQGIIQIANAALKQKMERKAAALRLCVRARDHLRAARSAGGEQIMGLRVSDVLKRLDSLEGQI